MSANLLWQRIFADDLAVIAIMGMSKNTGKTVTLNHLLACAAEQQVAIGVTSIGRDGEDYDQVYSIPKPPVWVWPGTMVATAQQTLQRSGVRYKIFKSTGVSGPMGEIQLVKVLDYGRMEIAGPSKSSEQHLILEQLKQCGCTQILLDGALGRSQHASPAIADGIILATGAALGGSITDVLQKTQSRLHLLSTRAADEATKTLCHKVFAKGGVALFNAEGKTIFYAPIASLNAGSVLLQYLTQPVATIAVSGAVGSALWEVFCLFAKRQSKLSVVIKDATKLFIDSLAYAAFSNLGAQLSAIHKINIIGLTMNPTSPLGKHFDAESFLLAAQQQFPSYAICDVMQEKAQQQMKTQPPKEVTCPIST